MKKETLFIAFSTQKGGMGKTAVTVLTSSYLHYVKGYRVAIIDCDFPQHSIARERSRDSDLVMEDSYFKRAAYNQFSTLDIKAYPVKESTAADAICDAENLMETSSRNLSPAMKENNNGYPQSLNPKTEVVNESSDNEYSL